MVSPGKKLYLLSNNIFLLILILLIPLFTSVGYAQEDISCYHCHPDVVSQFRNNIHYQKNFTCADCHGGNDLSNSSVISTNAMSGNFIGAPSRNSIADFCSKCHPQEAKDYKTSIHWAQIAKGHTDAATCTDCHGVHDIRAISDPNSSTSHQNIAATCAKCHSNKEMMSAWYYGIPTDRFDTYKDSFHGIALNKGYTQVATCADCHGNHDVKSPSDPSSSTYPDNLPKTCGKCHPGAQFDVKVAEGLVHDKESLHSDELTFNQTTPSLGMRYYLLGPFDLAYWIALFFKILTTGVIGIFAGMVILDCFSRIKIHKRW